MSRRSFRTGEGIFGYGHRGLPGEIDDALASEGAVEDLASEIKTRWYEWAERQHKQGGRRASEREFSELATLASALLRFHVRRGRVLSPSVADALDHVLGVVDPRSGQPRPNAKVLGRFGLPVVDDMDSFLGASLLDGEADAAGNPLSQSRLAAMVDKAPSTIRRWRAMPLYARRRKVVSQLSPTGHAMTPHLIAPPSAME